MPGNRSSPLCSMRRKLSRISCLTGLDTHPLARRSFKVAGRTWGGILVATPGAAGRAKKRPGPHYQCREAGPAEAIARSLVPGVRVCRRRRRLDCGEGFEDLIGVLRAPRHDPGVALFEDE